MITDHPYKSCFYARTEAGFYSAIADGEFCLCPYGIDRCHLKDCGKKREEHEICCEGQDVTCPNHGTEIGRNIMENR